MPDAQEQQSLRASHLDIVGKGLGDKEIRPQELKNLFLLGVEGLGVPKAAWFSKMA
jgi:hypothetical protein